MGNNIEVPKYPIEIFYSEEDECYIANVPDIKYCSAHGETPEEALKEIQIALVTCIESLLDNDQELPRPSKKQIAV